MNCRISESNRRLLRVAAKWIYFYVNCLVLRLLKKKCFLLHPLCLGGEGTAASFTKEQWISSSVLIHVLPLGTRLYWAACMAGLTLPAACLVSSSSSMITDTDETRASPRRRPPPRSLCLMCVTASRRHLLVHGQPITLYGWAVYFLQEGIKEIHERLNPSCKIKPFCHAIKSKVEKRL